MEDGRLGEPRHGTGESAPAFLSEPALRRLFDVLPEARVVGGAVRDTLAGLTASDIDLASPLTPPDVTKRLTAHGITVLPTGLSHGTVTAVISGQPFEITTLRLDKETDGRHASVEFTDDWRADAARRDFTINAMSMSRDGTVYDYFDGCADLAAGIVRFVGIPAVRLREDHLRVIRYFRFLARFGTARPDREALSALSEFAFSIRLVSVERLWSEFRRILAAPDPGPSLRLMERLGILTALVPEGADAAAITRDTSGDPIARLAAMLTGDVMAFSRRLKLSARDTERLIDLRSPPVQAPVFPLTGADLLKPGFVPGPRIGTVLRAVRAWWIDDGCRADQAACLAMAVRLEPGDGR